LVATIAALESIVKGTAATTYANFSGNKKLAIPRFVMSALSIAAATTAEGSPAASSAASAPALAAAS
jgi:hypothetical protein